MVCNRHMHRARDGAARIARRFAAARAGMSAVEFAVVGPVLVLLFAATIDVPRAFATGHRLSLAAGAMADLISRNDYPGLNEVYSAAQAVATPYDIGAARIVLSAGGVYRTAAGGYEARVCSSAAQQDAPRAVRSPIGPVPLGMRTDGARFVMAEVRMRYRAIFTLVPVLNNWEFSYTTLWPVREGKSVNGRDEVILPGGQACPPNDGT